MSLQNYWNTFWNVALACPGCSWNLWFSVHNTVGWKTHSPNLLQHRTMYSFVNAQKTDNFLACKLSSAVTHHTHIEFFLLSCVQNGAVPLQLTHGNHSWIAWSLGQGLTRMCFQDCCHICRWHMDFAHALPGASGRHKAQENVLKVAIRNICVAFWLWWISGVVVLLQQIKVVMLITVDSVAMPILHKILCMYIGWTRPSVWPHVTCWVKYYQCNKALLSCYVIWDGALCFEV